MPTKRSARPTTLSCGPVQHVDSVSGSSPAPPVSHVNVGLVPKCSMRSVLVQAAAGRRCRLSKCETREKRSARSVTTSRCRVQYPNYAFGTSAADPRHRVDGVLARKSSDACRGLASVAADGCYCMQTSSITLASTMLSAVGYRADLGDALSSATTVCAVCVHARRRMARTGAARPEAMTVVSF